MAQLKPSLVSRMQSRWIIAATCITVTLSKCTQVMIPVEKVCIIERATPILMCTEVVLHAVMCKNVPTKLFEQVVKSAFTAILSHSSSYNENSERTLDGVSSNDQDDSAIFFQTTSSILGYACASLPSPGMRSEFPSSSNTWECKELKTNCLWWNTSVSRYHPPLTFSRVKWKKQIRLAQNISKIAMRSHPAYP